MNSAESYKGRPLRTIAKIISRYIKSIAIYAEIVEDADRLYVYDNSIVEKKRVPCSALKGGQIGKIYTAFIPE